MIIKKGNLYYIRKGGRLYTPPLEMLQNVVETPVLQQQIKRLSCSKLTQYFKSMIMQVLRY